jgi:fumarate hydratase, class II
LAAKIEAEANEITAVVTTGRRHVMDALPLTTGQEGSGRAASGAIDEKRFDEVVNPRKMVCYSVSGR